LIKKNKIVLNLVPGTLEIIKSLTI
jgi:hypothetical protein